MGQHSSRCIRGWKKIHFFACLPKKYGSLLLMPAVSANPLVVKDYFPLGLTEFAISIIERMQAQEILRSLRLPEFDDFSQFFRNLPATALVGIGAFAAVVAYWFASRPKAVKPPCDLLLQSEEVEVRRALFIFRLTNAEV